MIDLCQKFCLEQSSYTRLFHDVWAATSYISEDRSGSAAEMRQSAMLLRHCLRVYGAGTRRAPKLAPVSDFEALLADEDVRRMCTRQRRVVGQWRDTVISSSYHLEAIRLLHVFAQRVFSPATTNVLYPLKMLMLLTGLGPAPDSRVREALVAQGFPGWTRLSEKIPEDANAPAALRLLDLWALMAVEVRTALPVDTMLEGEILWLVRHGAFGRLVDMKYFQLGKLLEASAPVKLPRKMRVSEPMEMMPTWAARSQFAFEITPDDGYFITFGTGTRALITNAQIAGVLTHFAGRKVPVGTSRNAAPPGSLGHYLQQHISSVALASYVAPLLLRFHGAQRVRDNQSEIQFPL